MDSDKVTIAWMVVMFSILAAFIIWAIVYST